jgi:hypothetical protein
MAEGPIHNLPPVNPSADDDDTGSDFGVESIAMMTSSPTCGAALMAKGEILELLDFFKKTTVTDEECQAYHNCSSLTGNFVIPYVMEILIKGNSKYLCANTILNPQVEFKN